MMCGSEQISPLIEAIFEPQFALRGGNYFTNKLDERFVTMILDSLEHSADYLALHPHYQKAFAFLTDPATKSIADGRYEISGEEVFALVFRIDGKARSEAKVERHQKHIDIQCVFEGIEEMGWRPASPAAPISTPYLEEKDVELYKSEGLQWITVTAGNFAIFTPHDIHAPGVSAGPIHKIVIKVRVK